MSAQYRRWGVIMCFSHGQQFLTFDTTWAKPQLSAGSMNDYLLLQSMSDWPTLAFAELCCYNPAFTVAWKHCIHSSLAAFCSTLPPKTLVCYWLLHNSRSWFPCDRFRHTDCIIRPRKCEWLKCQTQYSGTVPAWLLEWACTNDRQAVCARGKKNHNFMCK